MKDFSFLSLAGLNIAHAEGNTEKETIELTTKQQAPEEKKEGGLSIEPTTVAFQALNFLILLGALHLILYKPLVNLLNEREKKIKDGVENAEKADLMLKESNQIRQDVLKRTNSETQEMVEKARKTGEEIKNNLISSAQDEADKIIKSSKTIIDGEKEKAMQEVKSNAVNAIILAAEKILKEKLDPAKDAKLIEESIKSY